LFVLPQDKRPATAGAAGSSGFLSSLGKVSTTLMTGVKDMRLSSPRSSPHDLSTELRSSSSPNISLMAREATQRQQQQQQNGQQQRQQQEDQLPPGWEAKYDAVNKRVFYVDHNTKTTTWSRPVWTPAAVEQPAGSGSSPVSAGSSPASAGSQQQQQQQSGWPAGAGGGSGGGQVAGWSSTGSLARKSRPGSSKAGEDGASGADSDSGVCSKLQHMCSGYQSGAVFPCMPSHNQVCA
jgi:hypothetical protein